MEPGIQVEEIGTVNAQALEFDWDLEASSRYQGDSMRSSRSHDSAIFS